MEKTGTEFLNRLYKDMHMSDVVMHTASPSDKPSDKIEKYLNRLERVHTKAKNHSTDVGIRLLKKFYYDHYVIKPENISNKYWQFLDSQYFNQRGVHMTEEEKFQHIQTIISDQKKSLDKWIDYLSSEDTRFYPTWAKYWAFQGMLNIGAYDNKNDINYLLVTTGADSDYDKYYNIKDAYEMYNYFFTNYSYHVLVEKNSEIIKISTKYLKDDFITFKSNEDVKLLYNNNDFDKNNIKLSYTGIKQIKPFTKRKEKLGVLDIYYKDKVIKSIDIILESKSSIDIIKVIKGEWFTVLSIFIFLFSLTVFIFTFKKFLKSIR